MSKSWTQRIQTVATLLTIAAIANTLSSAPPLYAQDSTNEPGLMEPVSSHLKNRTIRVPNTDQTVDDVAQNLVRGEIRLSDALQSESLLGHSITKVTSPNADLRAALEALLSAAQQGDNPAMNNSADELISILLGTTVGRIYDGFSMLNFNRWSDERIGPEHFPPDAMPNEYKMKTVQDTGRTFTSPFDGEERRIWEADVAMLYYDGQIDSDTFLLRFPVNAHPDDTVEINYRIFSLVREDFSPTLVMLDRLETPRTTQFPFKGLDSVWIAFDPGQILDVTVKYPPIGMVRGVYTWGWRVHPPRIQFLQPIYEIVNAHTQEVELNPQGRSFAIRNRDDLTLDAIGTAAPEMKMYEVAIAVKNGATPTQIEGYLLNANSGPSGTLFEWADLALDQLQLPPEAWDRLAEEDGLSPGDTGDFDMISVFLNNEMYGKGRFGAEVLGWDQGEAFKVKLLNLDRHTHYFRNVDFGTRLHDDIQRCCGGGETSFEVFNFKPSYGAPKVAEMQWRAGWGFRPHYNVIQQPDVFSRASDRQNLAPYTGGFGETFLGYQYSEEKRGGDFRFNPPPGIITEFSDPSPDVLRDADGEPGIVIGQSTEGYGVAQLCPQDEAGFCQSDFSAYNPHGAFNWPEPANPNVPKTELRFPPFLRNPAQGDASSGDIIPPTSAWRPFLWTNPNNGSIFLDPDQPNLGHWADLTFSHGAPVFQGTSLTASIELPRASGQVFYQFDDLFHDNTIFSPHPLFEGVDETDELLNLRANRRSTSLRVRGRLTKLSNGDYARWITVFDGPLTETGCTGIALGNAPVNANTGRFIFRKINVEPGQEHVCVRSIVSAAASVAIR